MNQSTTAAPAPFVPDIIGDIFQNEIQVPAIIASLASASGTSPQLAALGVAAILGSIAGPKALIEGECGDAVRPHFNLITFGGDNPAWLRLQRMLLEPVQLAQGLFREISAAADPTERAISGNLGMERTQLLRGIAGKTVEKIDAEAPRGLSEFYERRNFQQPTFLLSSPSPSIWKRALPDLMDRHVAVFYPDARILEKVIAARTCREWLPFLDSLLDAMGGADGDFPGQGFGRISTLSAALFLTGGKHYATSVFTSKIPEMSRLLGQCLLLDGDIGTQRVAKYDRHALKQFHLEFRTAVHTVLSRRRSGGETCAPVDDQAVDLLLQYSRALQSKLAADDVLPKVDWVVDLPWKLAWGMLAAKHSGDSTATCVRFAIITADAALAHFAQFLRTCRAQAHEDEMQLRRQVMLGRISRMGPCAFRDLARTYRRQSKAFLGPVIEALVADGLVERKENLYAIRDAGDARLLPAPPDLDRVGG